MLRIGKTGRCCSLFGLLVGGVFTLGLSVGTASAQEAFVAPKDKGQVGKAVRKAKDQRSGVAATLVAPAKTRAGIRLGPGHKSLGGLPVLEPVIVDYRSNGTGDQRDLPQLGPAAPGAPQVMAAAAVLAGQDCNTAAACNDCNVCTEDACADSTCDGGPKNGFACESNSDCGGVCIGGLAAGTTCTSDTDCCGSAGATCDLAQALCVGGANDGQACADDTDCPDIPSGLCNFFTCKLIEIPPRRQCINAPPVNEIGQISSGRPTPECSDGLGCNGIEVCNFGAGGVTDNPTCALDPNGPPCGVNEQCFELAGAGTLCDAFCNQDSDCNRDQLACTVDVCDVATGLCSTEEACGPGGKCTEGARCVGGDTAGNPCTSDADCVAPPGGFNGTCPPGVLFSCEPGRCCDGSGSPDCVRQTFDQCEAAGGAFLATDSACQNEVPGDPDTLNNCPVYSGGIAPSGTFEVAVGGVTSPIGIACSLTLTSVGDDYEVPLAQNNNLESIKVRWLRFAASVEASTRFVVTFHDRNGVFIQDVFFPDGVNAGVSGPGIRQVLFEPPLVVDRKGFFVITVARNFSRFGAFSFISTDAIDIPGTINDPNLMWINGGPVSNFLGRCNGGLRDGLWCEVGAGQCGIGTCDDVPDILAFEIVGDPEPSPIGGCCDKVTGACTQELEWICEEDPDGRGPLAASGTWHGAGSKCRSCTNKPATDCSANGVADCPPLACVGGNRDGLECIDDSECLGSPPTTPNGTCTGTPICQVLFACTNQACCDGPSGDCTQVKGECTLVDPSSGLIIPCVNDTDCGAQGPCLNTACPIGSESKGHGTKCDPNLCEQPGILVDKNNCVKAGLVRKVIHIPPSGDVVSVTVTGNNGAATFDDFDNGLCQGGPTPDTPCTPDDGICDDASLCSVAAQNCADASTCRTDDEGQCGVGGTCTRLCGSGFLNPAGANPDPGWWESWEIDGCADVRIDFCGTAPVMQPVQGVIWQGCPCSTLIGDAGVLPPIGTGEGPGSQGFQRGIPFCDEDNLWQTFPLLAPGVYYKSITSSPNSSFGVPPGGTYQFHITAKACRTAACCGTVCVGGARDGLSCNTTAFPECPGTGAECIGGRCMFGPRHGFVCDAGGVNECPNACVGGLTDGDICDPNDPNACGGVPANCTNAGACGGALGDVTGCSEVNELECNTSGNFWKAGTRFPDNICDDASGTTNAGKECTPGQGDCPGGTCVSNPESTFCGGNPCDEGSCCFGAGRCEDRGPQNVPMTEALCDAAAGSLSFFGGARCLFVPSPCPVCTAEDPGNCQFGNSGFIIPMDRVNGGIYKVADDFVARTAEITEFCFSPAFVTQTAGFCSDPSVVPAPPPDNYEIRFFDDDNGVPGNLIHELAPANIAAKNWTGGISRVWDYSIAFDPPLGSAANGPPFVVGDTYWIEFSGEGNDDCVVFLFMSEDGNDFFYLEDDPFDLDNQLWTFENRAGFDLDAAFCIGGAGAPPNIEVPGPVMGACCECDGTCTSNVSWDDCMGFFCLSDACVDRCPNPVAGGNCAVPALFNNAKFFPRQTCAEIGLAGCPNLGGGAGACPGLASVEEDCLLPKLIGRFCATSGVPCTVSADCPGGAGDTCENSLPGQRFNVSLDNRCSTTDGRASYSSIPGPDAGPGCDVENLPPPDDGQVAFFFRDKWFEYHATCTGVVKFDFCGDADLDDIVAVFRKTDDPMTPENEAAICANKTALGADVCPPPLADLAGGQCRDLLCADDFPGGTAALGEPSMQFFGNPGDCYIVRWGGFSATPDPADGSTGIGQMTVECETRCAPSLEPVQDQFPGAGGSPVDSESNRYVSFTAGDAGRSQAIRVRFGGPVASPSLPPNFASLIGTTLWVQQPQPLGAVPSAKIGDPVPPGGDFINVATLGSTPFFMDWTTLVDSSGSSAIHVYDVGIVPSVRGGADALYDVQVFDSTCLVGGADDFRELNFSTPLTIRNSVWADVTGAFSGGRPTQGDGVIDTKDIIAGVDGFSRPATSAPKQKVDLLRNGANPGLVDGGIDFVGEVTRIVDAAGGASYPF